MAKLKSEAADNLKADESRIRVAMMADHREKESALCDDLSEFHQSSMKDLKIALELHAAKHLKKSSKVAAKHLKEAEVNLSHELKKQMEQDLLSLSAHHMSERDDMTNELNEKMRELLEDLKSKSVMQFKHESDAMHLRFNEDCEQAKILMGNLFGKIMMIESGTGRTTTSGKDGGNVAYIVRIQQQYAEMHGQQVRTATTLAEIAREASRLRRDLRESKRAQLLSARAAAAGSNSSSSSKFFEHVKRESSSSSYSSDRVDEDGEDLTSKMLMETNRRLVDKLHRMSHRYSDMEEELATSLRTSSAAAYRKRRDDDDTDNEKKKNWSGRSVVGKSESPPSRSYSHFQQSRGRIHSPVTLELSDDSD